jgi:uncharacterized protein (TIGR03790 family)
MMGYPSPLIDMEILPEPIPFPDTHRRYRLVASAFLLMVCLVLFGETSGSAADGEALPAWNMAANTIVVYNSNVPESVELAKWYGAQRGIAEGRMVGLACSIEETIPRGEFEENIKKPLMREFGFHGWWKIGLDAKGEPVVQKSNVSVIVLMHGMPLRILQEGPREPDAAKKSAGAINEASVDSELAALGRPGDDAANFRPNPYFGKDIRFNSYKEEPVFLVGRIDGPNLDICRRLVTDALKAEKEGLWGRAYFDLSKKTGGYEQGEVWIKNVFLESIRRGIPAVIDRHETQFPIAYPMKDAILYLGWYSGAAEGPFVSPGFRFTPGAVACHIYSYSASSVRKTDGTWVPALLERGAAVVPGNVWEPFLDGTTHLDIFSDRLFKGYSVAEAGWMATKTLSWMNVIIGDPLYRPFAGRAKVPEGKEAERTSWQIMDSLAENVATMSDWKVRLFDAVNASPDPVVLESLGQGLMEESGLIRTDEVFKHAALLYKDPVDQLRCWLHRADLQRVNGNGLSAIAILKEAAETYKDLPEAAAALALLRHLEPSVPAPVAPEKVDKP